MSKIERRGNYVIVELVLKCMMYIHDIRHFEDAFFALSVTRVIHLNHSDDIKPYKL